MGFNKANSRKWKSVEDELRKLMDQLLEAPAKRRAEHTDVPPVPGVYLFYERGIPVYVGQTRNLRGRIAQHCRPSSRHNQASFAFRIAKEDFESRKGQFQGTRKKLEADPSFSPKFTAAKARVSNMTVRFVSCDEPEVRTVFEVYAATTLGTRYNSFETH